jgi:hypothetical protein
MAVKSITNPSLINLVHFLDPPPHYLMGFLGITPKINPVYAVFVIGSNFRENQVTTVEELVC